MRTIHEAASLNDITDMIQAHLTSRRKAAAEFAHPTDPQSIIAVQAALLARRSPHGTTIVAVKFKDGVIMAADRLATYNSGEVFSRTEIKLHDINQNAVIGICGMIAFAQHVVEDMEYICEMLSKQNKRPVSIPGKSNLLKQIIEANRDEFIYHLIGVSFGAILGGYDRVDGPAILSFNTAGGVHGHECFATDGSGGSIARNILSKHFQYDMPRDDAACLALGAIREAGRWETSVSHPLDPPPTVKIIGKDGIKDIDEESITQWVWETEEEEKRHLFANRMPQQAPNQEQAPNATHGEETSPEGQNQEGSDHGTA